MSKKDTESNLSVDASKKIMRMMFGTLFSTTWRVFAPTLLLFLLGLIIDINAETKPWGMITGTAIGVFVAMILVVLQLKEIRAERKTDGS